MDCWQIDFTVFIIICIFVERRCMLGEIWYMKLLTDISVGLWGVDIVLSVLCVSEELSLNFAESAFPRLWAWLIIIHLLLTAPTPPPLLPQNPHASWAWRLPIPPSCTPSSSWWHDESFGVQHTGIGSPQASHQHWTHTVIVYV